MKMFETAVLMLLLMTSQSVARSSVENKFRDHRVKLSQVTIRPTTEDLMAWIEKSFLAEFPTTPKVTVKTFRYGAEIRQSPFMTLVLPIGPEFDLWMNQITEL